MNIFDILDACQTTYRIETLSEEGGWETSMWMAGNVFAPCVNLTFAEAMLDFGRLCLWFPGDTHRVVPESS